MIHAVAGAAIDPAGNLGRPGARGRPRVDRRGVVGPGGLAHEPAAALPPEPEDVPAPGQRGRGDLEGHAPGLLGRGHHLRAVGDLRIVVPQIPARGLAHIQPQRRRLLARRILGEIPQRHRRDHLRRRHPLDEEHIRRAAPEIQALHGRIIRRRDHQRRHGARSRPPTRSSRPAHPRATTPHRPLPRQRHQPCFAKASQAPNYGVMPHTSVARPNRAEASMAARPVKPSSQPSRRSRSAGWGRSNLRHRGPSTETGPNARPARRPCRMASRSGGPQASDGRAPRGRAQLEPGRLRAAGGPHRAPTSGVTETFDARAIFAALAAHDVSYVTVGGVALQAHGAQRLTQDLDIVFDPAPENARRLARHSPISVPRSARMGASPSAGAGLDPAGLAAEPPARSRAR